MIVLPEGYNEDAASALREVKPDWTSEIVGESAAGRRIPTGEPLWTHLIVGVSVVE